MGDEEISKRLTESGWQNEDVAAVMKKPNEDRTDKVPDKLSIYDMSTSGKFDLGIDQVKPEEHLVEALKHVEKPLAENVSDKSTQTKAGGKKWLWIVTVGVLILAILGGGYFLVTQKNTLISPLGSSLPKEPVNKEANKEVSVLVDGKYENKLFGFSITPPAGWKADNSGTFGTLVVFTNPELDVQGENKFTANMNIVAEDTNQTLDEYVDTSKGLLAQNFTSHTLVSESQASLPGESAKILESTFDQGIFKLHNLQLVTIKTGKAYVVTTVSLDSNWEKYKTMFAETINSFELK